MNLLAVLSLLNFASGYRIPLHEQTGRGAWDNMRALVFSLFLTSSTETDWLSAKGMQAVKEHDVAEHLRVSVHVERPHESIPGVTVGALGGPMHQLVQLIARTLNETGDVLVQTGYPDLGTFVLEALRTGEKVGAAKGQGPDIDTILEQIVRAIPGFRDMSLVNGQRELVLLPAGSRWLIITSRSAVYAFKKALFLIHAISIRFGPSNSKSVPVPDTSSLPVFSDNVLPSLLIHLGILDISQASNSLSTTFLYHPENLSALLEESQLPGEDLPKQIPADGPTLTEEQAYILRAAAVDACEMLIEVAHSFSEPSYMEKITLPDIDMWLWAVAKDRSDYRDLERFVLRDTVMF